MKERHVAGEERGTSLNLELQRPFCLWNQLILQHIQTSDFNESSQAAVVAAYQNPSIFHKLCKQSINLPPSHISLSSLSKAWNFA